MHHIPPLWTSFSNCTATSPAVLHHRLPDHFQHTTVHQHRWLIRRHNTTSAISHSRGFWTSFHEAINTAWRGCLPRSVHFARSFSVLTTPERSSLSPHCLFRAACSLKKETPCPSDFLSSASDTCAHTHVCTSSCRTSADYVLLILKLLYYENQFTPDRDDYLPCPVSMPFTSSVVSLAFDIKRNCRSGQRLDEDLHDTTQNNSICCVRVLCPTSHSASCVRKHALVMET